METGTPESAIVPSIPKITISPGIPRTTVILSSKALFKLNDILFTLD
ncbi:442L [Invertebrate iridescent virus 6]|uniref:442L n=1 Tax=Invertebrate iridescent virus 6 TaxID=176652 RepID=Q91F83_IIV6|nr:442L [Invertebrate iridescent virus 6]AAK82302.1 442L [Invertebrate iridescent virus 6]QMS79331.1 hypothetical protein IIV6-T1_434 [Invertebrate iridescent virus 6]